MQVIPPPQRIPHPSWSRRPAPAASRCWSSPWARVSPGSCGPPPPSPGPPAPPWVPRPPPWLWQEEELSPRLHPLAWRLTRGSDVTLKTDYGSAKPSEAYGSSRLWSCASFFLSVRKKSKFLEWRWLNVWRLAGSLQEREHHPAPVGSEIRRQKLINCGHQEENKADVRMKPAEKQQVRALAFLSSWHFAGVMLSAADASVCWSVKAAQLQRKSKNIFFRDFFTIFVDKNNVFSPIKAPEASLINVSTSFIEASAAVLVSWHTDPILYEPEEQENHFKRGKVIIKEEQMWFSE